jgi:hypothetical protein
VREGKVLIWTMEEGRRSGRFGGFGGREEGGVMLGGDG